MIRDSDSPSGARQKLVFEYDHQGRRIRKQSFTYNGGWQEQTDTIFLYDGWNLVAELNANASNARVRTYVWGSDLSGTMHGAGGVGGLLKLTYYGTSTTNAFVAYDGNGNVTALIDAANGNVCVRYEYGPFAEPIRSSGSLSKLNPIRFSTKYTDNESGFLYYGYRYYNPSTGRWLSRDPIEEWGGVPMYVFVGNAPSILWEADGRFTPGIHIAITIAAAQAAGLSPECGTKIARANADTDIWHPFDHSYHYTRPVRGNKKDALEKSDRRKEELLAPVCELARKGKCSKALKSLGRGLHVAQDYYSHVYNGEPVSWSLTGRYPPDDDPNHRDHGRDEDMGQAILATLDSFFVLMDKKPCLGCCCEN